MTTIKWSRTKTVLTVVMVAGAVLAGVVLGGGSQSAQAAPCPTNDIMPCGASSPSKFISKLKANKPSDMNNIYAAYGLPSSQYDEFKNYAKSGKINPDNGNITVDGKTVGYDGLSLGRNSKGSISKAVKIDGKTYYQSHIKDLTKYFNDAMVLFDAKGNVQTVVMDLCGNPIKITPKNPTYNCDGLNVSKVDNETYNFSSNVSTSNGATVTKVVYDFGDGSSKTETSASTVVSHKYAKPGNYTASVTAYVKTTFSRGEFPITVTGACMKPITVNETANPKVEITKTVDGVKRKEVALNTPFTYQLVVKNTGNVDLKDVLVSDPSPNANIIFVSTDQGKITNNTLSYTVPALAVGQSVTINITAKLTAYVAGDMVNTACVDSSTIPGSPDDCDTSTINTPNPGIKIEKLVNGKKSDKVAVDETFTYTIKVTNTGDATLLNSVVTDLQPNNIQFLSTDKGAIYNGKLTYTIPSLAVGESTTISLTAKVINQTGNSIKNTACVNAPAVNPSNPDTEDDCDDAYVTVPNQNISIVKTVNNVKQTQVAVGEMFAYKIVVKNTGDIDLSNVVVHDNAPSGVMFVNTSTGVIANNGWSFTIPSLKVGESQEFIITAKVTAYQANAMVNTACVNAPEVNPNSADDDACDTATVTVPTPETPPTVLPNTGAGSVIGIFSGIVVVAGLAHRLVMRRVLARQ